MESLDWGMLGKALRDAKMAIATISFIIMSLVGGYQLITEYFVTKVFAKELVGSAVSGVQKELDQLKKQTKSQQSMLVEMRLIRLENKIAEGKTLTPTELRVYDKLKKQYETY